MEEFHAGPEEERFTETSCEFIALKAALRRTLMIGIRRVMHAHAHTESLL